MGRPAEDGLKDLLRTRTELREITPVHDEVVRGRDHVPEPPAELPRVPHEKLVPGRRCIAPLPLSEPLEPHLWRGIDRHDLNALPQPFPERFKLARSTQPVHDNPIAPEARDRPFGPDA